MENNNYSGQLDPFHLQSYNGIPPAVTYPNGNANANQNPSGPPSNMFYPPIDFSVPPPNFTQMNVSSNNFHILFTIRFRINYMHYLTISIAVDLISSTPTTAASTTASPAHCITAASAKFSTAIKTITTTMSHSKSYTK